MLYLGKSLLSFKFYPRRAITSKKSLIIAKIVVDCVTPWDGKTR
jgi:hypothetical protein